MRERIAIFENVDNNKHIELEFDNIDKTLSIILIENYNSPASQFQLTKENAKDLIRFLTKHLEAV